MKTGRKYNVTIDGQQGRITDVIPTTKDYKGIAWEISKKAYSKIIKHELINQFCGKNFYQITLQNGNIINTFNDQNFVYIV